VIYDRKEILQAIVSICKECGKEFQLSPEEQSYFDSKRLYYRNVVKNAESYANCQKSAGI
jgi:hypothetical protein